MGGRGEDTTGSEGRRQRPWSTRVVAAVAATIIIFLEEETRAAGGRGWEQKVGAAGERRRDLVQATREGREMAGMAAAMAGRRGIEVAEGEGSDDVRLLR
ncbi:hypothetical protein BHM03_00003759 [Ensete ventricosum]|nr:hypothetical protein BHM03_00003759 [Ensete ventricosum]